MLTPPREFVSSHFFRSCFIALGSLEKVRLERFKPYGHRVSTSANDSFQLVVDRYRIILDRFCSVRFAYLHNLR